MNILLIDDDRTSLDLFGHRRGTPEDATTTALSDPQQALAWCQHHTPDLVLVDYMMPGMDAALASSRQYKHGRDFAQARSFMPAAAGRQFAPECLAALLRDDAALAAIQARHASPTPAHGTTALQEAA